MGPGASDFSSWNVLGLWVVPAPLPSASSYASFAIWVWLGISPVGLAWLVFMQLFLGPLFPHRAALL